jgi:nucleoside-diphosphate kinase
MLSKKGVLKLLESSKLTSEIVRELEKDEKSIILFSKKINKIISPPSPEVTLTIIKPDAVSQGLIGEVIKRLEKKGVKPVAMKMAKFNALHANLLYLSKKASLPAPVYNSLVKYITSKKVVLIIWQGKGVVNKVRKICGPTNPKKASKSQIRSLSTEDLVQKFKKGKAVHNIIHSSENSQSAQKEINLLFPLWQLQ